MQSSIIAKQLVFDNYNANVLIWLDILSVIAAIAVVINKNPIVSVLFLIGLFLGIACHLIFSGLTFIGLSYLLVYVGAVSILFLFILMLINIRTSELTNETTNTIPLALIIVLLFNYPIIFLLPVDIKALFYKTSLNLNTSYFSISQYIGNDVSAMWNVSSQNWDSSLSEVEHISNLGDVMYTSYSIWLIITSIILLLSMVGAIVITIKKNQA